MILESFQPPVDRVGFSKPTTGAETDKINSEGDTEILNIGEEQVEDVADKRVLMEEDQARTDLGQSHVALTGPDPKPIHDDFVANVGYGKTNMETEVESMVTVPIHQASSLVPLLSIPIIDLTHPKPVPSATQAPTFAATTETTTTTTLPPQPPQQQSTADQALASRISALETDLPHKINQTINEAVKKAIQVALQAPLRECFRDLSEADLKEILHDRMFKSGSYRSQPKHVALYEALEASMECDNGDTFLVKKEKSRKRRRDDQDPPSAPSKEPYQSKKKKHDSDASGSIQTPAQTSSAWKTPDTRDAPSSSSKQKSIFIFEQPVQDIPIPNDVYISDTEESDATHHLKIKPIPDWLKPFPKEERPKTPEPDWVVPLNDYLKLRTTRPMHMLHHIKTLKKTSYFRKLMEECHMLLTDQIDLGNPNGHRVVPDVSKPLPLGGPPGQPMVFLIGGLSARNSILPDKVPPLIRAVRSYMQILSMNMMRETEVHKFSDGTLTSILEKLDNMVKDFKLFKSNPGIETRIWSDDDRRRSKELMEVIEPRFKSRRIFRSLECFVSGRLRDVNYRLIQRTD
nr:hypothetical protein [Tanacetum cinerariifolium]